LLSAVHDSGVTLDVVSRETGVDAGSDPATDGTGAALDAYLDGMAAGSPLPPAEEEAELEAASR
jgi:hypothetical protein